MFWITCVGRWRDRAINYYERHLGDYARDTGHLSLLEHGAYTLLLDRYYATEEGIPAAQAYRIARARTTPEREAVDAVLAEFFRRDGDCWRQGRVEAAIAEFQEGDEERAAKRDNAKERQRRTRARRKDLFDQLREAGIVPAWDTATNELERLLSRAPSQPVTPPVTRDATATHTPDTNPIPNKEQEQKPLVRQAARYDEAFELSWSEYPKRGGGNSKAAAAAAWTARIRSGESAADMAAGVIRYAKFIRETGKEGTEFVKQAATFLGPDKHYLDDWIPPRIPVQTAAPSKTLSAIQRLEDMKNGLADTRNHDGLPETPLLGFGPNTGH